MTPFQWDYPTQGLRFPRTTEEAFGPYARLELPPRISKVKSTLAYLAAAALALASAVMIVLS